MTLQLTLTCYKGAPLKKKTTTSKYEDRITTKENK